MAGPVTIRISASLVEGLERAAWQASPHEACALLLGQRDGDTLCVTQVAVTDNVTEGDPQTTFEIDPSMHLLLQKAARVGGPAIVGVWHSHPEGVPEPSETDKAQSVEPGWVWLISAGYDEAMKHAAFLADEHDPHLFEPAHLEIAMG